MPHRSRCGQEPVTRTATGERCVRSTAMGNPSEAFSSLKGSRVNGRAAGRHGVPDEAPLLISAAIEAWMLSCPIEAIGDNLSTLFKPEIRFTAPMLAIRLLLVIAGLIGASGVALAAAASHAASDPAALRLLAGAAAISLSHAPALLGLVALHENRGRLVLWPAIVLATGTMLFVGDLIMRVWLGRGLFPMAAPAGGLAMVAGWLLVAAGAIVSRRRDASG